MDKIGNEYVKRTQKNYSYAFKLQVNEKTQEQELMELRQQIKLLEKQNRRLEKELEQTDHKAIFFDMMIDIT